MQNKKLKHIPQGQYIASSFFKNEMNNKLTVLLCWVLFVFHVQVIEL